MTDLALRPRSSTEIIDLAVRLLRRHFGALFTIALVGLLPGLVVQLIALAVSGGDPVTAVGARATLGVLVSVVMTSLMLAALTVYADDVLRTGAGDVRSALGRGARRLPAVLGASILSSLASLVGFLLFIVPGVYVALRFTTALPAAALEGAGPVEALRRAWARGEGHVGHTFATLLLLGLVFLVFFVVIGIVAAVVGVALAFVGARGGAGVLGRGTMLALVLTQAVTTVVTAAVYPLLSNAVLVLAYDLRVRREGYDVEAMADALGAAG